MRPRHPAGAGNGAQRLVWLLPALFLLGVRDTDLPTAVGAAVLVGACWQAVYRRALRDRLVALTLCWTGAEALVLLDLATWPAQAGTTVALMVLVSTLVATEHALRVADRCRTARDDGAVPAGT